MNGVKFDTKHSYDDLDLILSSKTIGSPSVKITTVDIPGADGVLDFTEFFGEPKYNNRTLTFEFRSIKAFSAQLAQDSSVKNALHGKKMKIVLDDDPNYYFYGRVSVGDWESENNIGKVTITCDCDPYKRKQTVTTATFTATTTEQTGTITNSGRMTVVPTVEVSASTEGEEVSVTLQFDEGSISLGAGTYTLDNFALKQGTHTIKYSGTGTIKFTFREGEL